MLSTPTHHKMHVTPMRKVWDQRPISIETKFPILLLLTFMTFEIAYLQSFKYLVSLFRHKKAIGKAYTEFGLTMICFASRSLS